MTTKQPKARRVEAGITRKQLADAAGISQFKLDRIERGVDVDEESRKAYDAALAKLVAAGAKASTKPAKKPAPAKKATTTVRRSRTRKTTQPKADAADEPKAEVVAA
jgi:transcriptional regulator with XRE-family HTH domain